MHTPDLIITRKVYNESLNNLKDKTEEIIKKYKSCAVLWTVHFAPKFETQFNLDDAMTLIGSDSLIKMAQSLGVEHIFCGHTHLNRFYTLGEDVRVHIHCAGTSTCTSSREDTTIHLRNIMIENNQISDIEIDHFKYIESDNSFQLEINAQ